MAPQRSIKEDLGQVEAIHELITQNNLDAATSRFLDLARYRKPALRNEAILLTRRWTQIGEERRLGQSAEVERKTNELVQHLLELTARAGQMTEPESPQQPIERPRPGKFVDGLRHRGVARLTGVGAHRVPGAVALQSRDLRFRHKRKDKSAFELVADPFELRLGELTGLVGPNAAGKTTLMRVLAGEVAPLAGAVTYPATGQSDPDWYTIHQSISYMPQISAEWHGTMLDNLRFEAAAHGYLGAQNDEIVDYILGRLRLDAYSGNRWSTLSAGYRTRFALARALVSDPAILILDEPLAFLDPGVGISFLQDVVDLIRWADKPIAALVSSQHIHEIEAVADQLLYIEAGHVHIRPSAALEDASSKAVFEIRCSLSAHQLRDALNDFSPLHIAENVIHCTVTLPEGVHCCEALARVLRTQTTVQYFRDITGSTKLNFQQ